MNTRIALDLNVRVRGNQTYAGFEDVEGAFIPTVGEAVEVYERESGISGKAEVTEVDEDRKLVFLLIDWALLSAPLTVPGGIAVLPASSRAGAATLSFGASGVAALAVTAAR